VLSAKAFNHLFLYLFAVCIQISTSAIKEIRQRSDTDRSRDRSRENDVEKNISRSWTFSFFQTILERQASAENYLFCSTMCTNSRTIMMTLFLRDLMIKKFDIIIVQKSWINAYTNITHHFLKDNHFLFYSNSIEMKKNLIRVCMFVIKRIFIDDLKYLFRSKNVMIVQIHLHKIHYLHLHNVYNESNILSSFALQNLRFALLKSSSNKHFRNHIIVKNLNIHHSSWNDSTTRSKQQIIRNAAIDEWISITI
jgi:hypothetical protein